MIISWIIAAGVAIGAADMLFGNRFGLGKKFLQGFELIGSMMLSMAGIMALAPVLANCLKPVVLPIFRAVRIDPAMMGIILGSDMGGYQLAMSLAENRLIGIMAGVPTAGMLGGTLIFCIPLGFSLIEKEDYPYFSKGILIGICAIPVGSITAGVLLGIPFAAVLWNNVPVLLLSILIVLGFIFCQQVLVKIMEWFGKIISWLGLVGIAAGSFTYLTDIQIISGMTSILETMKIVCSMAITLFGMFPVLELFGRAVKPLMNKIESKTGLDATSCSGLIFSMANTTPVYPVMKNMCKRGIVINAAWLTCCAALFGSQLALVMSIGREYLVPYLAAKLSAGVTALLVAAMMTRKMK